MQSTQFHSGDSRDERVVDKSGKFPGILLGFSDIAYRRIYFFTYEQMQKVIDRLVQLQGFADRADQYEKISDATQGVACAQCLVRHKLTGTVF